MSTVRLQPLVFVVDDEEQICSLLQRILAREGYDVRAFSDPQRALVEVSALEPDLIVTDLMMPGLSGLELLERARAALPSVRAVVITGYASIDNVVDALRSGVDDFVTKPFSVAEIRAVTARLLDSRERTDTGPVDVGSGDTGSITAETATRAPSSGIRLPDGADPLAHRLTEMSLTERIHGFLAEQVSTRDLLGRCAELLRGALGISHSAILVPGRREAGFRVHAGTAPAAALDERDGIELGMIALIAASGAPADVDRSVVSEIDALLDLGPLAAAPLTPRGGLPDRAGGVLIVSRPAGAPRFDPLDLRRLGVAAGALGDVFRAVRSSEDAVEAYIDSLSAIVAATETRCPWFQRHSERVRDLSLQLGERVGLAAADLQIVATAAQLLDLGRFQIPDDVLAKSGDLTDSEWRMLRDHSLVGDTLLRPIGHIRHVKPVVRHHHENWDGTGYPDGLRGQEIPYLAALVRVTDAYCALTAPRAWRPAQPPGPALRTIRDLAGRHFHPDLVTAFVDVLSDLSNEDTTGEIGR